MTVLSNDCATEGGVGRMHPVIGPGSPRRGGMLDPPRRESSQFVEAAGGGVEVCGPNEATEGAPRWKELRVPRVAPRLGFAALAEEELAERGAALLGQHARCDFDLVIEPRLVDHVEHRAARAGLEIGRASCRGRE